MIFAALGAAFVVAALLVGQVRRIAGRLRFLDRPGSEAHKAQARSVPYGGGIGMALAMALVLTPAFILIGGEDHVPPLLGRSTVIMPLMVGAGVLFLLGLVDDWRPQRAWVKLAIQAVVCAGAVWAGDLDIDSLHGLPILAYGLAWCWLLLITNAYNLLDHADGLSASVALVSAGVLLIGSIGGDDLILSTVWATLMGCLAGFLVWNLPPARIYMGDSGSLPLGFLIGVGTLSVTFWPSEEGGSPLAILSPLLITAIPLFDTAVVVVKRLRRGQPLHIGDRNHISHRLSRLGVGPRASLAAVVALQISLAAGALQLRDQEWTPGLVVLAQSAAVLLAVVLLETSRDG